MSAASLRQHARRDPLSEWRRLPARTRAAIAGLGPRDFALRGGDFGASIHEYSHHLVEANLVAAVIILAALGRRGCVFDWSWMIPNAEWVRGVGYRRAPLEPALALLDRLVPHVASLLRAAPKAMQGHVRLLDAPGAKLRRRTVAQLLAEECEHAAHHLQDIASIRKAHGLVGRRRARSRARSKLRAR